MRKDRDSFFSSYGVSQGNINPPFSFDYNSMNNMHQNNPIEDRINRLEREISRLDARISALEKDKATSINNTDYNFANSMYMI